MRIASLKAYQHVDLAIGLPDAVDAERGDSAAALGEFAVPRAVHRAEARPEVIAVRAAVGIDESPARLRTDVDEHAAGTGDAHDGARFIAQALADARAGRAGG